MPLLEINQIRHICAFVQHESTAAQVDQYAAFIRASADGVVDQALNYVFSKDRDFQDFLKTLQAKQGASTFVSVKGRAMVRRRSLPRSLQPGWSRRFCEGVEAMITWRGAAELRLKLVGGYH